MITITKTMIHAIGLCAALVTPSACLVAAPAFSADSASMQAALKQTILSLDKARNTVIDEQVAAAGDQGPDYSREDALLFIAYLQGRINYYCYTLYVNNGPQSLEGLPCSTGGQGVPDDPGLEKVPEFSGQTSEEKVASLDQEFSTTLGEFDDMLLEEQERVSAHIPRQRESAQGNQYGQSSSAENSGATAGGGAEPSQGSPGDRGAESDPGETGDGVEQSGSAEGAGQGRTKSSRVPPTEGSRDMSEDDDVVARQLREAAEQETDPEVKEKLWEEYRKYKEGIK